MNTTCLIAMVTHVVKSSVSVEGSAFGGSGRLVVSPVSSASVPFRAWAVDCILDGQSLFIAERCRPTDGGDFQVNNYLPSSAAPEGRQPETEQIEAAGTVFDSKLSPVERVSPGSEQG